jgi:mono/diheme cytochrome c family protein
MTRTALLFAMLVAVGCGSKNDNPQASGGAAKASSAEDTRAADDIFSQRCTPCHGATGGGDGPASATLTPKPRNFGDKTWAASVTDAHIEMIIVVGGAGAGKSPAMPGNPDLAAKPGVVTALRSKIRSFSK